MMRLNNFYIIKLLFSLENALLCGYLCTWENLLFDPTFALYFYVTLKRCSFEKRANTDGRWDTVVGEIQLDAGIKSSNCNSNILSSNCHYFPYRNGIKYYINFLNFEMNNNNWLHLNNDSEQSSSLLYLKHIFNIF